MIIANAVELILGAVLILSSIGVITARKPVHASLFFLLTLVMLAGLYLEMSAEFIAVMQVLVYAGAILVIFMFVIVLFQDAHQQIAQFQAKSKPLLIFAAALLSLLIFILLGHKMVGLTASQTMLPKDFGTVQALGHALYVDFFFPFEAVILLFLVAVIGAHYIGKKGRE